MQKARPRQAKAGDASPGVGRTKERRQFVVELLHSLPGAARGGSTQRSAHSRSRSPLPPVRKRCGGRGEGLRPALAEVEGRHTVCCCVPTTDPL